MLGGWGGLNLSTQHTRLKNSLLATDIYIYICICGSRLDDHGKIWVPRPNQLSEVAKITVLSFLL